MRFSGEDGIIDYIFHISFFLLSQGADCLTKMSAICSFIKTLIGEATGWGAGIHTNIISSR